MPVTAPRLATNPAPAGTARLSPSAPRAPRRRERGTSTFPLRDWRRAFAIVDRLNAEFRGTAWFRGIRAFWDRHRDEIAIEVEVGGPSAAAAAAAVPLDLRGRAILFRDTK